MRNLSALYFPYGRRRCSFDRPADFEGVRIHPGGSEQKITAFWMLIQTLAGENDFF
jgi:hypothetical protein